MLLPGPVGTVRRLAHLGRDLVVTGRRYAVDRVPNHRRATAGPGLVPDMDRDLPGDPATLQRTREGVGPLFHRHYWVVVADPQLGPEQLVDLIAEDPNHVTPAEMARFETLAGAPARALQVGDELVVRLPGPWNGPVRVIERGPTSLRLATLVTHMEAGEIAFRASRQGRSFLVFEIESWARSGDRVFHVLYERFPVGRELQLHMWAQFCLRVAEVSGGTRVSDVSCTTDRVRDVDG